MRVDPGHEPDCPGCLDPAKYHLLTAARMTELLRQGAESADELDRSIRHLFALGPERNFVLR